MATIGSKTELLAMQKKYVTDAAIGKVFGISRQAVHHLRKKYGIVSVQARHGIRNKEICSAYKNHVPVAEIMRCSGLCIAQVYRIIKRGN